MRMCLLTCMQSLGRRLDGAKLVAKAWVDPAFKARLLSNPAEAAAELGINTINSTTPTKLKVGARCGDCITSYTITLLRISYSNVFWRKNVVRVIV